MSQRNTFNLHLPGRDKDEIKTFLLSTTSTLSICNDNSLVTKIHPISRMAQSRQISQQVVNFSFNPSSSWHHIILLKSAYYHITTLHPPLLVLGWLLYCHLDKSNLYHFIQDSPLFSLPGYFPLLFFSLSSYTKAHFCKCLLKFSNRRQFWNEHSSQL